jgi:hypothetical protein
MQSFVTHLSRELGEYMEKQAKKLVLSKETLRSLDDQELSGVVGGTGTIVCVESALCNSGICCSVLCESAVCHINVFAGL